MTQQYQDPYMTEDDQKDKTTADAVGNIGILPNPKSQGLNNPDQETQTTAAGAAGSTSFMSRIKNLLPKPKRLRNAPTTRIAQHPGGPKAPTSLLNEVKQVLQDLTNINWTDHDVVNMQIVSEYLEKFTGTKSPAMEE